MRNQWQSFLPFSDLTLLVGRQEGHLPCKNLYVLLLVVTISLELWTFIYGSCCHHHLHHIQLQTMMLVLGLGLEAKSLVTALALEGRPWHKLSRPLVSLIFVFFLPNAMNFLSFSLLSVSDRHCWLLVVASNAVLNSCGHLHTEEC